MKKGAILRTFIGLFDKDRGKEIPCTASVLGKTLEQLYVLMRTGYITYISTFQIMDGTSWRG
jgi:hypothetical protein